MLDSLQGMVVGRDIEDFFDMFWPQPPSEERAQFAEDQPEVQPHVPEEFKAALESMIPGTGSCAGPLADLVRKFDLWPGHELSLRSSDPNAFCWGTMQPRDDPRPSWARPQVLFRFGKEDEKDDERYSDVLAELQHQFTFRQLTALFVVLVHGRSQFSVARWDRSGVVESVPIPFDDADTGPHLFMELFRRLSAATDEQMGLDNTAAPVLPGSADYELMDRVAEPCAEDIDADEGTVVEGDKVVRDAAGESPLIFNSFREGFARMLQPPPAESGSSSRAPEIMTSRWRLCISTGNKTDGKSRDFLVGRPFQSRGSSGGLIDWRNTRSYVALDCRTQRFVFLKDAWRGVGRTHNPESEGAVLAMLNAAGVPHVPTVLCHAGLQRSVTARYYYRAGRSFLDNFLAPNLDAVPRKHFRMVVQELGLKLNNVTSGRQAASVINDCVVAHAEAAKALKMLHGDLGPYNILICPKVDATTDLARPTVKWKGMLIDWEAVKWLPGAPNYNKTPCSLRTPSFQSIDCMLDGAKRFEIADELESILYTLLWIGVRWLRSNCTDARTYLDKVFDQERGLREMQPSAWKRRMLERNELLLLDGTELRFHGDHVDRVADRDAANSESDAEEREGSDNRGETPFDSLLRELLSWCHANAIEYVRPVWDSWPVRHNGFIHLDDRPPGLERPDSALPEEECEAIAARLYDHDAILELFARKLDEEWPTDDFAGDRWQVRIQSVQPQVEQKVEDDKAEEDKVEALISPEEPPVDEEEKPKSVVQIRSPGEKLGVMKGKGDKRKKATETLKKAAPERKALQPLHPDGGLRYSRRLRKEPPLEVEERPPKRRRCC